MRKERCGWCRPEELEACITDVLATPNQRHDFPLVPRTLSTDLEKPQESRISTALEKPKESLSQTSVRTHDHIRSPSSAARIAQRNTDGGLVLKPCLKSDFC